MSFDHGDLSSESSPSKRRASDEPAYDYSPLKGPNHISNQVDSVFADQVVNSVRSTSAGEEPSTIGQGSVDGRTLRVKSHFHRGHAITYAGLFLFTIVLYFRPYDYLPLPSNLAFVIALVTLVIFFPSQVAVEGNLTARPREVNLLLLLSVTAVLSMPLALDPAESWDVFTDYYLKVAIIFVVMVNAVRTRGRLKGLIFLSLAVAFYLSFAAFNDYRLGNLALEGRRVKGVIGGMFGNPNDMAIHLVTMIPIAVALLFASRSLVTKLLYGSGAALMMAGVVVTFSRGAFLGLVVSAGMLCYKLARRNRLAVFALAFVALLGFAALAPGDYGDRLISMVDHSRDEIGSASARQDLLIRSVVIAVNNPLFGVGMGNFHIVSIHEQPSHNAFTQVAAEMGLTAFVLYTMFLVSPLRRLSRIERDTADDRGDRRFHHLSIGLQASIAAYMVSSFFGSVAYLWYAYYLVGYAVCLRRIYEAETGVLVLPGRGKKETKETVALVDAT